MSRWTFAADVNYRLKAKESLLWPNDVSPATKRAGTVRNRNGIPQVGASRKGREGHRVNTQIQVLRIVSAATAAFIIFLIVHNALQAFSQAGSVLTNA